MSNQRSKKPRSRKRAPGEPAVTGDNVRAGSDAEVIRGHWPGWVSVIKIFLGGVLVLGVAGFLAWGAYRYARTTPRFAVHKIEVAGLRRLAREDVLAQAGIRQGDNVFQLDVKSAELQLVESPWIRSARVTRRLPGTVQLELVEREPVALAVLQGQLFLVSQGAEPFKPLEQGDPADLPLVTGLSVEALRRDRRAELERLALALNLIHDFEMLPMARKQTVEEVHLDAAGHAILRIGTAGLALHLGPPPWKKKLLRAERVIARTRARRGNAAVVFVDNEAHPERVVVRLQ